MRLADVVETSRRVTETSRKLEKTRLLEELLRKLLPDEIETVVAFLSGRLRQGKLGVGYRTLQAAMNRAATEVPILEVMDVERSLSALAAVEGKGSTARRADLLGGLFAAATAAEQRFLAGLLMGELRQGALEGLMLDAVAKASGIRVERVRRAAMLAGNMDVVARAALVEGENGLEQFQVQMFRPVQPMLAQSAEDLEEALTELGEAALEYKMDGARVQLHRSGDEVIVYSRLLNDVTAAVPEIVEAVRAMPAKELILDGEVICLRADGRPQPFQVTMRRFGRRLDVERMKEELPLSAFWFDALRVDGEDLLDEAQSRRFSVLEGLVPADSLIPHTVAPDAVKGEEFLQQALQRGHEGVMAKARGAAYAAGSRGQNWLKVKQARTVDLVVLAAEWGNGRRKGWLSNLHLGALDAATGGFAMLGKTFKGLTDEMLEWQTRELLKLEVARDAYTVYVKPELVVEIAFQEMQATTRYAAGMALRFARVKRYRTDKKSADAETVETMRGFVL